MCHPVSPDAEFASSNDAARGRGSTLITSARRGGQFRIVLAEGLRIEVEAGFDAAELRRLIAALDNVSPRGSLPQSA
ncbi:hypothetical protein ACOBR2_05435 [Telmatobacter bradus]|uniref:hypothetical protein n=1 Tax=Telmatobacter bradus TaxID=474953 RepID=UPI003B431EBE